MQRLGCCLTPSVVHQADGSTLLNVVGQTRLTFTCEGHECTFEGLIVTNLDVDFPTGNFFMEVIIATGFRIPQQLVPRRAVQ